MTLPTIPTRVRSAEPPPAEQALPATVWPGLGRVLTPLLLVVADVIAIQCAFFVAWHVRYNLGIGGDVETNDYVPYDVYLPLALMFSGLIVVIFFLRSLYRRRQAAFWFNEIAALFSRTGFAVIILLAASTWFRYPANSRLTFVYLWLLATVFTSLGRLLVQCVTGELFRAGIGTERVVIVGDNSMGRMVLQGIAAQPHLGLQLVGFLGQREDDFGRFRYLGPVEKIDSVCHEFGVHQVIIALPSASHEMQLKIVEHCRSVGVRFMLVPDVFEMSVSRLDLDTVSGIPLIGLKEVSIEGWDLVRKRTLDLSLTCLALIPLGLVMLIVALWVRIDSRGPVIYKQIRVGKGGRQFTIYKFRSMRVGAERELSELLPLNEKDGPIFKKRDDPRMTRAGRWIRRASLDELPQLINVLRGEMSLVGPRPPLPREVEQYEEWHLKRLKVAPGLTGLWQVSGRSNVNFEEMVVFDLAYIQNWSISLDLSIILRTLPAVVSGGGAF